MASSYSSAEKSSLTEFIRQAFLCAVHMFQKPHGFLLARFVLPGVSAYFIPLLLPDLLYSASPAALILPDPDDNVHEPSSRSHRGSPDALSGTALAFSRPCPILSLVCIPCTALVHDTNFTARSRISPLLEIPFPNMISNSACFKRRSHLILHDFHTGTWFPTISPPCFNVSALLTSIRTDA